MRHVCLLPRTHCGTGMSSGNESGQLPQPARQDAGVISTQNAM